MTYHEGQAVIYKPRNVVAYVRRVNNRPEVSETQRNYQVEVNGYLVTVYADQEDTYLAPAPPKVPPPVRKPTILGNIQKLFTTKKEVGDPDFRTQYP